MDVKMNGLICKKNQMEKFVNKIIVSSIFLCCSFSAFSASETPQVTSKEMVKSFAVGIATMNTAVSKCGVSANKVQVIQDSSKQAFYSKGGNEQELKLSELEAHQIVGNLIQARGEKEFCDFVKLVVDDQFQKYQAMTNSGSNKLR
ncbi:MAG TPA: hypothetical protein VIY47_10430, partial [Ignavibacteriaceae bacterium]